MRIDRELELLAQQTMHWLLSSGLRIVVILIGAFIARRALNGLARQVRHAVARDGSAGEHEKRAATLVSLLETAITLGVFTTAAIMILRELGVAIGPVLASAGIAGLAIGFGAQNLVRDVVAGFFMLLENQYREGDMIQAAGVSGEVERFGLRATVLRDVEGRVHTIPNGEIKLVSNLTKDWSRAVIDVEVPYKEDVDRVIGILERLGEEIHQDPAFRARILETEVPGVERLGESSVALRVLLKTTPLAQFDVAREFRRRVVRAFAAAGIEFPLPHRTLYLGEGRQQGRIEAAGRGGEPPPPRP